MASSCPLDDPVHEVGVVSALELLRDLSLEAETLAVVELFFSDEVAHAERS
jgi:hypothetical protein